MRERSEGCQEEAGGSELESWQAGKQPSNGPGVLERETTVKNTTWKDLETSERPEA